MFRIQIPLLFKVLGLCGIAAEPAWAQHHHHSGHSGFHSGHSGFHSGHSGYHSGHSGYHSGHLGFHSGHLGYHSGLHIDVHPHHSTNGYYGRGIVDSHYDYPSYSRRVFDHHHDYHYVVPSYAGYGAYYRYGNESYYTSPTVAGRHTVYRPQPVAFGGFSHVDELSARLERAANQLCLDLYYNYNHNPGFKETYREAYQLLSKAKYVHGSEHGGDQEAIRQTLGEMDSLFHHVVDDLTGWSRHVHRPIGHGGAGPKVAEIEALIHHLMNDAGVKPAHDAAGQEAPNAEVRSTSPANAVQAPEVEQSADVAPDLSAPVVDNPIP